MEEEIFEMMLGGKVTRWRLVRWMQGSAIVPIEDSKPKQPPKPARVFSWDKKTGKVNYYHATGN